MKKYYISMVLSLALLGCGSGGGDDNNTETTNQTSAVEESDTSKVLTGKVVDGYIEGSVICIDLDKNYKCDNNDVKITTTNKNGEYTFEDKYKEYPHIAIGGVDTATGDELSTELIKPVGVDFITPINTIISLLIENGDTLENAKTKVANILEIDEDKLSSDPIKNIETAKATLKIISILQLENLNYKDVVNKIDTGISSIKDLTDNINVKLIMDKIDSSKEDNVINLEQGVTILHKVAKTDSNIISNINLDELSKKIKDNNENDVKKLIDDYKTQLVANNGDVSKITFSNINSENQEGEELTLTDKGYGIQTLKYDGVNDSNLKVNLPKGKYIIIAENNKNDLTTQFQFLTDKIQENNGKITTDTIINNLNPRTTSSNIAKISITNDSNENKLYTIPLKAYFSSSSRTKPSTIWTIVEKQDLILNTNYQLTLNKENKATFVKENENPHIWRVTIPENGTGSYNLSVKGDKTTNPVIYYSVKMTETAKELVDSTTNKSDIIVKNLSLEAGKTYTIEVSISDSSLPLARPDMLGSYVIELNKQ